MSKHNLDGKYNPNEFEEKIYKNWEEKGYLSKEDFITDLEKFNGRIEGYGYNNWYEVKPKPEAEKYLDVKKIADLITHIQDTFEILC